MHVRAPAVGPYPMSQHAGSTLARMPSEPTSRECHSGMRSLLGPCLALDSRLGQPGRAALSGTGPPGLHNHDSKLPLSRERGLAQLMESALSGNVDAPIGAIAAVYRTPEMLGNIRTKSSSTNHGALET